MSTPFLEIPPNLFDRPPLHSLGTFRTNIVLVLFFFLLDVNLLILTIAEFTRSLTLQKVAGGEGLALAAVAFYAGAANLFTKEDIGFTLPVGSLSRD